MRKTLINSGRSDPDERAGDHGDWLDLEQLATLEITSEDPLFPADHALGRSSTSGWRASSRGPQVIRLNFDHPTPIRRIHIRFVERDAQRSQEFSVHAVDGGNPMREIVRQQFTFSPDGATEETEDFSVDLRAVTSLEVRIDPDRAHDPTHSRHFAKLQSLRIA